MTIKELKLEEEPATNKTQKNKIQNVYLVQRED